MYKVEARMQFIKDHLAKSKTDGVVVGVSGGKDFSDEKNGSNRPNYIVLM